MSIKKTEARQEYGGYASWLKHKLDLPDSVDISAKSAGMYSNMTVTFEFPGGETVETGAYFSSGIVQYYHVDMWSDTRETLEELAEEYRSDSDVEPPVTQ
jgi:hypothetical protein